MSTSDAGDVPGLYGKLPALGDFVTRRLPRTLVERWDLWLQDALACSREQLGEAWLNSYLNAPIWRFALSDGVVAEGAAVGLLMPSVDRVGRYFPLTLMLPLRMVVNPAAVIQGASGWFVRGETLLLGALDDGFDFDAFDRAVTELGAPDDDAAAAPAEPPPGELPGRRYAAPGAALDSVYAGMVDRAFRADYGKYSLWWTAGSEDVEPSFVVCEGLPKMSGFAAFLDGAWARWGWSADGGSALGPAAAPPPAPTTADPLDGLLPPDRA